MISRKSKNFFGKLFKTKSLNEEQLTETKLARVLSTLDLTLLGIGSTLGVGVYVLSGGVARDSAGPAIVISFLIAAVASAFSGFCYSEFGARVPKSGSAYVYCYYTVGEFLAFLIGWNLLLEYIIGSASVTKAFSTYLDELTGNKMSTFFKEIFPMNSRLLAEFPDFFAFGVVNLFSTCLAFGLRSSTFVNNLFTGINLCVVLFVIIAGSINAKPENWSIPKDKVPPGAGEGGFAPYGISGIIRGAATCFYGFIGFDCIATTGEEAKTPKKSIPIAITISLFIVFLTYCGISTVLTLMWPYYDQNVNAPLTSIFEAIGWTTAKWIVSAGALFGLLPSLLGSLLPLPRIIYAMASDGLMFRIFGEINEKYHSPIFGTIISGFFTGLMAMIFNLSQLIDMMSIGTLLAYTIVAACVLLLRYRKSEDDEDVEEFSDFSFSKKLLMHMFSFRSTKAPTKFSFILVAGAILVYCVSITAVLSLVVFLPNTALCESLWAALFILFVFLCVSSLLVIFIQPQSRKKLFFSVPFVPFVPAFSIAFNVYLMLMLDGVTWVRFGVWILIGVIIYFMYGINHSVLNKDSENSTEKQHEVVLTDKNQNCKSKL